jgi:hypothetical protein
MYNVYSNVETAIRALSDAIGEQRQLSAQSIDTEYNYVEQTYTDRLTIVFNGLILAQRQYLTGMLEATDQIVAQLKQDGAHA